MNRSRRFSSSISGDFLGSVSFLLLLSLPTIRGETLLEKENAVDVKESSIVSHRVGEESSVGSHQGVQDLFAANHRVGRGIEFCGGEVGALRKNESRLVGIGVEFGLTGEKVCPAMAYEKGWSALVVGGSGAIGRHLVAQLLNNKKFSSVMVIGRREIVFPEGAWSSPESHETLVSEKLRYHNIGDLSEIASIDASTLTPPTFDVAFCALGTTRKDAGSAKAFRKVDYDGAVEFGNLAKRVQAKHLQLVTSAGANKNSFFLYLKTKGETEEFYRSLGVRQLTILRPPLLNRGEGARFVEKVLMFVVPSMDVANVAKAMVRQAESVLEGDKQGVDLLETKAITNLFQAV